MRARLLTLATTLTFLTLMARAQDPSPLARILTFETDHPGGSPAGWVATPPGSAAADDAVVHGGRWSARLERTIASPGSSSGLSKSIPLDVTGKTIVVRAFLRTADVTGFVSLYAREDGDQQSFEFASTQGRGVKGTNDWQEHNVSLTFRSEAKRLTVGVVLGGTGRLWVDDVEVQVDGVPFSQAPKVVRPKTALDTDTAFDNGSGMALDRLSAVQIDNLTTLGQVWGFLKYHHPLVTSGTLHWDYELFRIMPAVMSATDRPTANATLAKWISGLGAATPCQPCATLKTDDLQLRPDIKWIDDETRLGADLSRALRAIYDRRPALPRQFYVSFPPGAGNPTFDHEPTYPRIPLPDAGFQILALYRFWNIIQYWHPYRDVSGEDWTGVLRDAISRVGLARTAEDFQRQMMAVIARVHDTHANLWGSLAVRPPVGACQLPIDVRFIEDQPVVTVPAGDFARGDILKTIDGVSVSGLIEEWLPYYAASNDPTRFRDVAASMTRGACGVATIGVTRGTRTVVVTAARVPVPAPTGPPRHDRPGETFQILSNGAVGYLKLSTITQADVPKYIEAAAGTRGLIIDIRNYPSEFVVFALGQFLVSESKPFVRFTAGDVVNPGAFHWGPELSLTPKSPHYGGKVVILVDEVSQSQAEYTAMAFRVAPGATVVGSTTAGADGNVSPIPLPGGLGSMISGIGVFYPDKTPTQRIGIVPDVVVRPTIAGIRDGRDEVLEAAIKLIAG